MADFTERFTLRHPSDPVPEELRFDGNTCLDASGTYRRVPVKFRSGIEAMVPEDDYKLMLARRNDARTQIEELKRERHRLRQELDAAKRSLEVNRVLTAKALEEAHEAGEVRRECLRLVDKYVTALGRIQEIRRGPVTGWNRVWSITGAALKEE